MRVRPKLESDIEPSMKLVLTPQFAKVLGRDYSYTLTHSSGTTGYNENLHMHEAYLQWLWDSRLTIAAGRMILAYGDQLILAAGEWPLAGRSFDGVKVSFADDSAAIDVLGLKIDSAKDVAGSDRNLVGVYTKLNFIEEIKAFELYGLYESNQQNSANEWRSLGGARVAAEMRKIFELAAEFATQQGSSGFVADVKNQSMIVASLGWKLPDFYKLRIGLEYNQADREWRDWYPLLKSPLGRNEVVGRRNLVGSALRVSAEPVSDLKLKLDYWLYKRFSEANPIYRPQDSVAVGTAGGAASSEVGEAIDLSFTYRSSDRVEYGIGGTAFFPGAYLVQQVRENRIMSDFYAVTNIHF